MNQDTKIQNLSIMLDSLKDQLLAEKLKLRKTQTLLLSKRRLLQSSHTLLETEFQGVFTDNHNKRRRRRHARPYGLVPLLEPFTQEIVRPYEHASQENVQATVTVWYSNDDDVIWVRAHVRNTLKSTLYNVQMQRGNGGLPRRSTVTILQVDEEIDVCATYQADPGHDVKQLDDLYLVYSVSDGGPRHCQRLKPSHVQDRANLTWLPKVENVSQSLNVFYPHWITIDGESNMDKLRHVGKMQPVPNSIKSITTIWISDDQRLLAVKSGHQNQVGCVDGMKLLRLVKRAEK
ncbi:hypothetical protein BGW37DRAFT_102012 [Umbelopsis sp. PMI_123]|nr:hypothetical protein BGW37DRAFT_102012 [Umbelopsis sp. PMI_123]